jgi:hypothetical protein
VTPVQRAAVLVGVNRTGGLPVLQAAARGARIMEQWALRQMPARNVRVLTDEAGGSVELRDVKRAIFELVEPGNLDQLIVYFAGHGVNVHYGEQWLLSGAPVDTQESVNVAGSVELATRCGIPHVVLVSDACRTAAEGIQAQRVRGGEIFPNVQKSGVDDAVDVFCACSLGRPALEVRDPEHAASSYRALYTAALANALGGHCPELIERQPAGGDRGVVQPWPLKRFLSKEVARQLSGSNVLATLSQVPDARITSAEDAWLAQFPWAEVAARGRADKPTIYRSGEATSSVPHAVAQVLLATLLDDPSKSAAAESRRLQRSGDRITGELANRVAQLAARFGPPLLDTPCGIKVRGARVTHAWGGSARAVLLGSDGDLVAIDAMPAPAANVLLELHDGGSVVVPALRSFIAALTFDGRELVDVDYQPLHNAMPGPAAGGHRVGAVHAVVSASAHLGLLKVEPQLAAPLMARVAEWAAVAPALALHAAYAFHAAGRYDDVRTIRRLMHERFASEFFDLQLLDARAGSNDGMATAFPPFPLQSHGWALLGARQYRLPDALQGLEAHLEDSLWTRFTREGTRQLRRFITREGS